MPIVSKNSRIDAVDADVTGSVRPGTWTPMLLLLAVATPIPERPTETTPGTRAHLARRSCRCAVEQLAAAEILDLDQPVAAVAGIDGPGVDGLGIDDRGADDQADRDRELGDDQRVAQPARAFRLGRATCWPSAPAPAGSGTDRRPDRGRRPRRPAGSGRGSAAASRSAEIAHREVGIEEGGEAPAAAARPWPARAASRCPRSAPIRR